MSSASPELHPAALNIDFVGKVGRLDERDGLERQAFAVTDLRGCDVRSLAHAVISLGRMTERICERYVVPARQQQLHRLGIAPNESLQRAPILIA